MHLAVMATLTRTWSDVWGPLGPAQELVLQIKAQPSYPRHTDTEIHTSPFRHLSSRRVAAPTQRSIYSEPGREPGEEFLVGMFCARKENNRGTERAPCPPSLGSNIKQMLLSIKKSE